MAPYETPMICTGCGDVIEAYSEFPDGKGGKHCLGCYASEQEDAPMPTADEIVAMWGGVVR